MESKAMPTAEEHYKNTIDYNDWAKLKDKTIPEWMHEYAVLFAKHHREKAIEAIKENIKEPAYSLNVHPVNFNKAIENAYSEDNIK